MSENGIQDNTTLQKQLEDLKKEQEEAERIFKNRMDLGNLDREPAIMQAFAQKILDRKVEIENLEAQISTIELNNQDYQEEMDESVQEQKETSLTEYHKNPIINWLQRIADKLEKIIQRLEENSNMIDNRKPPFGTDRYKIYQTIVNMDFSQNAEKQKQDRKSWKLSPKQIKQIREEQVKIAEKYDDRTLQEEEKEQTEEKDMSKGR